MEVQKRKENNRIKVGRFALTVLFAVFCMAGCGKEPAPVSSSEEKTESVEGTAMFAIVCNLDDVNGKITLRAVNYNTEVTLTFNGAADVRDKYGDILAMSQVELGSIVDVVYDASQDKLLSLHMSGDGNVRKMEGISGVAVDNLSGTVQINGTAYRIGNSIGAFSDHTEIGLDEICSEDQLTVWLYNDTICSFYVELGHGYVRLSDYASYLGGMVEIGYDVIVPVTEDMLLTVREGEYVLRITKGSDVGTKAVKVVKNQEINLSLADLAIEPKQTGAVLFKVTPSGAAVYIDGKKVNTEGAVDIVYGKHKIYITAEGYQSYSASFNVNYAYKIKEYTLLPEGATTERNPSNKTTTSTSRATESTTTETREEQEATTEESATEKPTTEESDIKDVTVASGTKTSNKVVISAPIGASVYFDGEYLGIVPISFTKVTGSHIITLSQAGYLSKSHTVTFTDDGGDTDLKYDDLISISSLIE